MLLCFCVLVVFFLFAKAASSEWLQTEADHVVDMLRDVDDPPVHRGVGDDDAEAVLAVGVAEFVAAQVSTGDVAVEDHAVADEVAVLAPLALLAWLCWLAGWLACLLACSLVLLFAYFLSVVVTRSLGCFCLLAYSSQFCLFSLARLLCLLSWAWLLN